MPQRSPSFLALLPTLIGAAAAGAQPASLGAAAPFVPLFDGTLDGWSIQHTTAGNIGVRDGVLRVAEPGGWLKSASTYGDFALRIEFRFLTDAADSGVFVRAVDDGEFGRGWPSNSYQVQLHNPIGATRFPAVGGIFRHGKPPGETDFDGTAAAAASTGTGTWQLLEIEVVGQELTVHLNGRPLTRAAGIENATGHIGLQAETGALEFRAIEIAPRAPN